MTYLSVTFSIFRQTVRIIWDQIELVFLRGVDFIMRIMSHLPGPLGAPFRAAHKSIAGDMAGIQRDVAGAMRKVQADVNKLHGKTVSVGVHATGSGGVKVTPSSGVPGAKNYAVYFKPLARGGRLPGFGGGDQHPVLLESGEAVVDKIRTRKFAPVLKAMGVPGMAAGGLAGPIGTAGAINAAAETRADIRALVTAIKTAVAARAAAQAATAGTGGSFGDSGVRSGSAAAAQAFARSIMGQYHWGANQWPPWLYLGNQESGWNAYAVNASSGAYGIGQSLGHGHPYNLGDYKTQVIWMANYIRGRYGNPANAWAHERAFNWYGGGLDAMFGKPTLIGVGERGLEHVTVTPRGRRRGEHVQHHRQRAAHRQQGRHRAGHRRAHPRVRTGFREQVAPVTTPAGWPTIIVEAGLDPFTPGLSGTELILDDAVNGKLDTGTLGPGTVWTSARRVHAERRAHRPVRHHHPVLAPGSRAR